MCLQAGKSLYFLQRADGASRTRTGDLLGAIELLSSRGNRSARRFTRPCCRDGGLAKLDPSPLESAVDRRLDCAAGGVALALAYGEVRDLRTRDPARLRLLPTLRSAARAAGGDRRAAQ